MTASATLDPAMLRECHARARGWAGLFRLPLRQRVWRGGSGDFMGRGTGSSLDFQDHRAYAPGDDPRHINWQAYARTGQYSMKLFREEVRPLIDIVLDVSPSMYYPEATNGKLTFSALGSAALATMLQRQRDAVGLVTFSDKIHLQSPVKSTGSHIHATGGSDCSSTRPGVRLSSGPG